MLIFRLATNIIYNMTDSARKRILADYHSTNYGTVNPRTLDTVSRTSLSYRSQLTTVKIAL